MGGAYANLGAEVTILEGSPQILPTYEKDLVKLVEDDFKKKGVTVVTNAMAKEAIDNGDSVTVKYAVDGKEESVTADYVMVTVGRRPNTDDMGLEQAGVEVGERGLITVDKQGRTNVSNIYAIGDIVPGAALAHKASYEAKIAAEAISGKKVAVDYKAMPAVAFTDPELASVGMTIKDAKDAGIEAKDYQKTMILIKEQLEDIQNGNLSDNDIQIAKIMLQNALRKTNDEAGSMIALAYNRDITHKKETNDEYIQKLLNVSKEDIINVAKKVQLDTIFFLTGKDFHGNN